jgi:hypothetical protein
MRCFYLFLNITITFAFFSCGKEHRATVYQNCQIDTTIQVLHIPSNFGSLYRICQQVKIKDENFLVGYDYMLNQLEIWNFDKLTPEKIIQIPKEGPGGMSEIGSFFYHNADTIFLLSQYSFGIINAEGESLFYTKINQHNSALKEIDFSVLSIYPDLAHSAPIYYRSNEHALYVPVKHSESEFSASYYSYPICARILLPELRVELLPIYYPQEFKDQWFGLLDKPNITFLDNKIIYSFKNNSRIFVYDDVSQKSTAYDVQSKFCDNKATPLNANLKNDGEAINKHLNSSPIFFGLIYDQFRDQYYRLHTAPSNTEDGTRRGFLTFLDADFNIIDEIALPFRKYALFRTNVVMPEGLILHQNKDIEDLAEIHYYNVKCSTINR